MLLISHAFPPVSTIGSLRWEKLTAYAATRGWQVDVLMSDPAQADVRDDSRLNNLPPGIRLFGVHYYSYQESSIEARLRQWMARALKRLRSSDGADAIPAAVVPGSQSVTSNGAGRHVSPGRAILAVRRAQLARRSYAEWEDWAERAAAMGIALSSQTPYEVVVSSGPPHQAHLAARTVADATGVPYALDFRDPWAHETYIHPDVRSPAWTRLSAYYERRAVSRASLIVMNTALAERLMRERYPEMEERIVTAMNGADPDLRIPGRWGSTFVISYAGQIYGGRDPRPMFRGVRRAIDELGIAPGDLEVRFMGAECLDDIPLTAVASECGLDGYFVSEPLQVRSAALALLQRSAMAVVLPQQYQHSIPGKVFEYVQAETWVLSLAERESATDLLLRDAGADCVAPDDSEGISRVVSRRYRDFRAGKRPRPLNADGRFDRLRQAEPMFDAIDRVVATARDGARPRRFSSLIERLG
ncbi:MAG: hypothetical protein MNPFHGCM_02042 [Gemmatimonadaceae bacterium]|nr:hypothetical protein [Gemmatimonadaceae bacterium]